MLDKVLEGGGEPAVSVGDRGLSYGELREAAAAVAKHFEGAERVAVWAESTLETCVAAVAALATGTPLVPINPKLGRSELEHVLTDSKPDVVLGGPDGIAVDLDARASELPESIAGDEDPALIIYTSGTTGRPKGAMLPRRAVASNLDGLADAWEWTGEDVLTHGLPLFHVHGLVLGLFGPLRRGGELRHLGRFEPAAAAAALQDGATMLFGVPTMYHRLGREAEGDASIVDGLKQARLLVSGSAPLPAPEFSRIEKLTGQQIVERYGLTETLMNTAVRADSQRKPGYVGIPVPGVEVRLVDDDGNEMDSHRRRDDRRGHRPRPEPVHRLPQPPGRDRRGDARRLVLHRRPRHRRRGRLLAHRRPPLDRSDQDRRLQGRRRRDRGRAARPPGVKEAAVTGEEDPDLGEKIIAWVVPEDDKPDEKTLIDYVAGELAPHKRPREVRFLDELPRNAMGKVVKQKLTQD